MNCHFQDEQRLKELAGRLGLLENQHRQTMEVVFGLKNQVNKRQIDHQLVNLYISNYGEKVATQDLLKISARNGKIRG